MLATDRSEVAAKPSISFLALLCLLSLPAWAGEATVPAQLQARLITRVAPFDRSLVARAGTRVLLLVVIRRDDPGSQQVAAELIEALKSESEIAGLRLEVAKVEVTEALQVLGEIRDRHPTILYLSTAFTAEAAALAERLDGQDLLTIAAESAAVRAGICVGFDLISGKPQVLIHLQQAKKQHVNFQATLLHLAKVVDQ